MSTEPRIVLGTDFSEGSADALHHARRLCASLQARLAVVHVTSRRTASDWKPDAVATAWLTAGRIAPDQLVVRSGMPWVELTRQAEEVSALLLVVGSHGRSGYQPLTLGSTASALSLSCPCPVAVVNPRAARNSVTA